MIRIIHNIFIVMCMCMDLILCLQKGMHRCTLNYYKVSLVTVDSKIALLYHKYNNAETFASDKGGAQHDNRDRF